MKAAYSHWDGLAVATLVVLLNLAAGHEEGMKMTLTDGGYGPSSSSAGPRINWTPLAVNAMGNFTLIGAASNDSTMKYVSFAFSNGTRMEDAFTVVDCYEIGNEVKVGTSKNGMLAGQKTSVNDPTSFSQVRLLSATKSSGVLTCSFEMKFMPTLEVKVMLAFGPMVPGANASSPKKDYHGPNAHFASASTIRQVLATSIMPSNPSIMSSIPSIMSSTPKSRATSMRWSCGLLPFMIGAMKAHLL